MDNENIKLNKLYEDSKKLYEDLLEIFPCINKQDVLNAYIKVLEINPYHDTKSDNKSIIYTKYENMIENIKKINKDEKKSIDDKIHEIACILGKQSAEKKTDFIKYFKSCYNKEKNCDKVLVYQDYFGNGGKTRKNKSRKNKFRKNKSRKNKSRRYKK